MERVGQRGRESTRQCLVDRFEENRTLLNRIDIPSSGGHWSLNRRARSNRGRSRGHHPSPYRSTRYATNSSKVRIVGPEPVVPPGLALLGDQATFRQIGSAAVEHHEPERADLLGSFVVDRQPRRQVDRPVRRTVRRRARRDPRVDRTPAPAPAAPRGSGTRHRGDRHEPARLVPRFLWRSRAAAGGRTN